MWSVLCILSMILRTLDRLRLAATESMARTWWEPCTRLPRSPHPPPLPPTVSAHRTQQWCRGRREPRCQCGTQEPLSSGSCPLSRMTRDAPATLAEYTASFVTALSVCVSPCLPDELLLLPDPDATPGSLLSHGRGVCPAFPALPSQCCDALALLGRGPGSHDGGKGPAKVTAVRSPEDVQPLGIL